MSDISVTSRVQGRTARAIDTARMLEQVLVVLCGKREDWHREFILKTLPFFLGETQRKNNVATDEREKESEHAN